MPYDRVKDFEPNGTLKAEDLNLIQDDYLARFEAAATGGFGVGPIAQRPAADVSLARGWLDTDGTEWRSNGVAWIPVGGRLPSARFRLTTARAASAATALNSWDVKTTDRVTLTPSTHRITAQVAGRYLLTLVMDISTQLGATTEVYLTNYHDADTAYRWFVLRPWNLNNTYVSRFPATMSTITELVPLAKNPNSYIELWINSDSPATQIVSAELNLQMIGA